MDAFPTAQGAAEQPYEIFASCGRRLWRVLAEMPRCFDHHLGSLVTSPSD